MTGSERRCPGSGATVWSLRNGHQPICDFCGQAVYVTAARAVAAHDADPRQRELVPA